MTNLDPTAGTFGRRGSDAALPREVRIGAADGTWTSARPALPPMPLRKRVFDLTIASALLLLLWPVLLGVALLLLLKEGRPILYLAERMSSPDRSFRQIKFRTMRVGADAVGGVTGGNKAGAISRLHRILRRTRLDELPQLINVLKGEMSLVGPRPPMRCYVEAFPEIYGPVLQCRPGLTGLATMRFHRFEERLLASCRTPEETEAAYRRVCVPRKAKLDLIYQRNWSLWFDLALLIQTARKPFWAHPGRRKTFPRSKRVLTTEQRAARRARRAAAKG